MTIGGDLVILGGGVIGLTTAYFLAREGVQVRVLDKGPIGRESSWAGAGILPPSNWLTAREPIDRLRALSGRLFPDLSAELRERTGIDNGFIRCGGLQFVAEHYELLSDEWAGEGAPAERVNAQAVQLLEPAVSVPLYTPDRVCRVMLLPTLAQVRNPRHLQALRIACERSGKVTFLENVEAHEFAIKGGRVRSVSTTTGIVEGDVFLIATGAWTDDLLRPLGLEARIRPIRGQIVLLNAGGMLFQRVLIFGSEYLVPRQDSRVLVGSTEENAGFVKQTTAVGIQGLLNLAVRLVPRLAKANVEQCWAGLRPGSPDGMPFIGTVRAYANLYVAAGHFRAGIQLSPGTAQLVKEMILGQPLTMPVEAFRLERMASA